MCRRDAAGNWLAPARYQPNPRQGLPECGGFEGFGFFGPLDGGVLVGLPGLVEGAERAVGCGAAEVPATVWDGVGVALGLVVVGVLGFGAGVVAPEPGERSFVAGALRLLASSRIPTVAAIANAIVAPTATSSFRDGRRDTSPGGASASTG